MNPSNFGDRELGTTRFVPQCNEENLARLEAELGKLAALVTGSNNTVNYQPMRP